MLDSPRDPQILPVGIGCYTAAEAARLLRTSPRQLTRWLGGYAGGNSGRAPPLWRPQWPRFGTGLEIGFGDLIELRFVLAFLRHGVPLPAIRRCLDRARALDGEERPLSTQRFRTDGRRLFLESLRESGAGTGEDSRELINLANNQLVFKHVVEPTFKDLEIADRVVTRWRPHAGKPSIVVDPARSFGKPIAAGFGVPTETLARAAASEGSARRAARLFEVPLPVVNDAVAFERSLMAA